MPLQRSSHNKRRIRSDISWAVVSPGVYKSSHGAFISNPTGYPLRNARHPTRQIALAPGSKRKRALVPDKRPPGSLSVSSKNFNINSGPTASKKSEIKDSCIAQQLIGKSLRKIVATSLKTAYAVDVPIKEVQTKESVDMRKRFKCELCSNRFTHKGSLATHMRIHAGIKPHICKFCGRRFTQSGNLATHVRTHTKERPFKCKTCNRAFSHKSNLNSHVKVMESWSEHTMR
mmetsp:Transcript_14886/g.28332  ORF Transcript_14886/g.28332 Transcript_14886/m.28332 type:complete len:231 (-) Transcript_14886:1235-1927(-)